jgi:dTDP-4-amino-4,6-dideoxygalactose transaminase
MSRIPFFLHDLGDAEVDAFAAALRSPILTTGDLVAEFERRFAARFDAGHAVALTSCTGAIHLALAALGIGPGDEVLTTPLTFVATATAVLQAGATPVFVDVEPDTGNLDAARVEPAITPRTKALLPVHLYGQMCDMRALRRLADRHGLAIVEDAAHCVEGRRDRVPPGALSDAACFSFYATKSLTCGEGGALVTRQPDLAERVRTLRLHGMTSSAAERERTGWRRWDVVAMGWKYNLDNLQAAVLLPQLERLDASFARRTALATRYRTALAGVAGVRLPAVRPEATHAWHLLVALVDPAHRDAIVAGLERRGVGVTVNYEPVHLTTFFAARFGFRAGAFPHAEALGAGCLSLPLYPRMADTDVDAVVERLADAVAEARATST